jgi:hypothetical protein
MKGGILVPFGVGKVNAITWSRQLERPLHKHQESEQLSELEGARRGPGGARPHAVDAGGHQSA